MMNFTMFKEELRSGLEKKLASNGYLSTVTCQVVTKNNGVQLNGLSVQFQGATVSPVIYIDSCYDSYLQGKDEIANIQNNIYQTVINNISENNITPSMVQDLTRYESVKNKIVLQLINKERNIEKLANIPYMTWYDLAIIFKICIGDTGNGIATTTVTNELLSYYGVDTAQLYLQALDNMETQTVIKPLSKVLEEMMGMPFPEDLLPPIFVVTNSSGVGGAASILIETVLDKLRREVGAQFYILPSSVHEMLVMPKDEENLQTPDMLRQMVKEVNQTEVSDEDFLSDNVYRYNSILSSFYIV